MSVRQSSCAPIPGIVGAGALGTGGGGSTKVGGIGAGGLFPALHMPEDRFCYQNQRWP